MYSRNTFITAAIHEYEWNHVFEMFLGSFEGPHPQNWPQNELDEPLVKDMWVATHQDLVRDVGKIFDPEFAALPLWLFVGESSESEPNLEVDYDHGIGRQFPAFLRQIGQQNTATIERVELLFGDLVRGADYFPIYAEILRQHFPKLRRLLIGK